MYLLYLVFLITMVIVSMGVAIHTTFVSIKYMPDDPREADLKWLRKKLGTNYPRNVCLTFFFVYLATLSFFMFYPFTH